jgi:trans-aconitate methyltransferase
MQYHTHATFQKEIARKLVEIASEFVDLKNAKTFADVGCGSGFIAEKLLEIGVLKEKITQFDHNPSKLLFASQFGKTQIWDFNKPYTSTQNFEIIFSSMALQWAFDFNKTLAIIQQMLADGGSFFFAMPVKDSLESVYKILGKRFMEFAKEETINARMVKKIEFRQNAYDALKSMHTLGLKVESGYKITKEMVRELKATETVWEIGVFLV